MNSEKNIYEELLKEHPELKDSEMNIQEIVTTLKKINPEIIPDETFKQSLKNRLEHIHSYKYQKKNWFLNYLQFIIPVFTFWFAIFWFMYFSNTTEHDIQKINMQSEWQEYKVQDVQLKSIQIYSEPKNTAEENKSSEIQTETTSITESDESQNIDMKKSTRWLPIQKTNQQENIDVPVQWIPENKWDMSENQDINNTSDEPMMIQSSMMMWAESYSEDSSEDMNTESFSSDMMIEESEWQWWYIYSFSEICWEYNWVIKIWENNENICIYNGISCSEWDFDEWKCMNVE